MFYIYVIYSPGSDLYYVGQTEDYQRRFEEHNKSERVTYTSAHRPWRLVSVFDCGDNRSIAMKTESFIKKQKSRKFIEKLISGKPLVGQLDHLRKIPFEDC